MEEGGGVVTDVHDLRRRPLEDDGDGRVGGQDPGEAREDVNLGPLDVDLHDVDAREVGQEVVEADGLDLDDLLRIAQAAKGVGADGADARIAGEVVAHVQFQFGRLRPGG